MITIDKEEAAYLRANGRSHDIHMANQQHKSAHKSYCATESPKTMKLLQKYRKDRIVYSYDGKANDKK